MGAPRQKKTNSKALSLLGEVYNESRQYYEAGFGLIQQIDIDLTKLVPELDTTASDIVTHQRDSLLSRKDLAQKTKDFRKLEDDAKLGEFKSLLKCWPSN